MPSFYDSILPLMARKNLCVIVVPGSVKECATLGLFATVDMFVNDHIEFFFVVFTSYVVYMLGIHFPLPQLQEMTILAFTFDS